MIIDLSTSEMILIGASIRCKIDNCIDVKRKDFIDLLHKVKLQIAEQIDEDELDQELLILDVEKIIFKKD
jgi:hypothetical protein